MNFIDLTGKRFGKLVVLGLSDTSTPNLKRWECICDCGNKKIIQGNNLHSGNTKSCGCLIEHHGLRKSKLYGVWNTMKNRCLNPNVKCYKSYGGRGISVCDEWKNSFTKFSEWSFENGYKEGLTLDRIDVNRNYEPSNCRWVDMKTQNNNRRNNVKIDIDGEVHSIIEWSRISGRSRQAISRRYKKGIRGKELIE